MINVEALNEMRNRCDSEAEGHIKRIERMVEAELQKAAGYEKILDPSTFSVSLAGNLKNELASGLFVRAQKDFEMNRNQS